MSRKRGLGRGLDVLLGGGQLSSSASSQSPMAIFELPVSELVQGPYQPRKDVADDDLGELVESIKQQGVLQPILVRALTGSAGGRGLVSHEIIAGERRWRAAKLAGLDTVPVVIRDMDDRTALAVALVENLQRKDLNPIEIAESLLRLTQDFELTHQQAAESIGRSRSTVSNFLRLLDLDYPVRQALAEGRLDMGHARALLPLPTEQQSLFAKRIAKEGLSVREVEKLVATATEQPSNDEVSTPKTIDLQTRWLQRQFADELGVKVAIRSRKRGGRTLSIDFADLEQLQGALEKIQRLVYQVRETAGPRVRVRSGEGR